MSVSQDDEPVNCIAPTANLTATIDRPLVLRGAHGSRGEVGRFDAVLLDVALRADQAAAALLRAEGI